MFHNQLSGLFQLLRKYDFRDLHFYEKNNRNYLRFHRPEKYGDDLTEIRYTIEYVNKEKIQKNIYDTSWARRSEFTKTYGLGASSHSPQCIAKMDGGEK